jgi:hypothetical protein
MNLGCAISIPFLLFPLEFLLLSVLPDFPALGQPLRCAEQSRGSRDQQTNRHTHQHTGTERGKQKDKEGQHRASLLPTSGPTVPASCPRAQPAAVSVLVCGVGACLLFVLRPSQCLPCTPPPDSAPCTREPSTRMCAHAHWKRGKKHAHSSSPAAPTSHQRGTHHCAHRQRADGLPLFSPLRIARSASGSSRIPSVTLSSVSPVHSVRTSFLPAVAPLQLSRTLVLLPFTSPLLSPPLSTSFGSGARSNNSGYVSRREAADPRAAQRQ